MTESEEVHESSESSESHESRLTENIILFVFLGLILSFFCYQIKKRFKVPVAPILIAVGVLYKVGGNYLYLVSDAVGLIDQLSPEVLNLVILPPLVFEASLATDWYTFKKELGQIIPMATTMVALSSSLAAFVIKTLLGYDFSWSEALLLGIILMATDHVAVVAQLKEIYASERLETLISGETLLNEAVVIMLYKTVLASCLGDAEGEQAVVTLFARLTFGGIILGLVFSVLMAWTIKKLVNDEVHETNLTLIATYMIFYLADGTELETSGAIGVVTFGLFMSAYGKTLVSPAVEETLHAFWKILAQNIESIVFIIGGMVLGAFAVGYSDLEVADFLEFLLLFVLLYVIRAIAVLAHYPIFKYVGYGITFKELIVVILGGIKGVISITLALMVFNNEHLDEHYRNIVLFFASATACFSIIFGSVIVKEAVKRLGLEELTAVQENMLVGVTTAVLQNTSKQIDKFKGDKNYSLVKWNEVLNLTGSSVLTTQMIKSTKAGAKLLKKYPKDSPEELLRKYMEGFQIDSGELVTETRRRYLTTLKRLYWHEFENGHCMGYTALILIDSANQALDQEDHHMEDWEKFENSVYNHSLMKFYLKFSKIPIIGKFFVKLMYEMIIVAYDAARVFIRVHHEAEELLDQMEVDIDKELFERVMEEAHSQIFHCKEFAKAHIIDSYPEIIAEVQTYEVCNALLLSQRKLIKTIYHQGLIQELEYENLSETIDLNIKKLSQREIPKMPTFKTTLKNRFLRASDGEIEELLPLIRQKTFKADEILFTEGSKSNGAYLILNGRVREQSSWIDQELITGNIVGVQHLFPEFNVNTTTATALTTVETAILPIEIINNEALMLDLYKEAVEELLLLNKTNLGLSEVKDEHLLKVAGHSQILLVKAKEVADVKHGGILLHGKLNKKRGIKLMRPDNEGLRASEDSIFMSFPKELGENLSHMENIPEAFLDYYGKSFKDTDTLKLETGKKMIEAYRLSSKLVPVSSNS
ncbi:unnamed protein product [Blepharisma stoltei]|uniref:Cyclic nucleotide-binding domain-containing protein n=1 Tax=Blepharisma stoltei TaxID=1481888 RepID=A0AAU9JC89_9CILI|nr:unnamed protein product [Blepharisma stoltei]